MIPRDSIPPILRDIADKEILTSLFMDNYSLMNGQMGVAIFFALLSRKTCNHWYEEFADELLENVCYNLSNQLPIDFAHGLCGIGWGIEFLKYRGFIKDDTDEILSEIDAAVMERDVRRINDASLETGLLGIHAYVTSRVNTTRVDSDFNPFDSRYISELNEAIARLSSSIPVSDINSVWHSCVDSFDTKGGLSWQRGISIIQQLQYYEQ